jgi:hypothetical protein
MLRRMRRQATPRRSAAGIVVLAALGGTWAGHTAEYLRIDGGAGLQRALLGGVHVYMLPLGAVLALAATVAGVRCWRAWLALGRRLDVARAALGRAWRGQRVGAELGRSPASVSAPSRWAALWLLLSALQVGLYLLQENIEAVVAGGAPSGLHPLLGMHSAAGPVQVAAALVLATALLVLGRRLRRRERAVDGCERLVRTLWQRLAVRAVGARRARAWIPSPADRLGAQLWRRPPPATF